MTVKSQLSVEMTGDERKLAKRLINAESKIQQLERSLDKAGKTGESSGRRISRSYRGAGKEITAFATHALSVGAAVSAITRGLTAADQEAKSLAQQLQSVVPQMKDLIQVTDGVKGTAAALDVTRTLRAQHGFSESGALEFFNELVNVGQTPEQILEQGVFRKFERDPVGLAMAIDKVRQKFGPQALGGSIASAVGALGKAGAESSASAGEMANLSLGSLALGKQLGLAPEEVISAVSIASLGAETSEEGATQAQAFIDMLSRDKKKRFHGLSLDESLSVLSGFSQDELAEVLGARKEAKLGYDLMSAGQDKIRKLTQAVFAEEKRPSWMAKKIEQSGGVPRLAIAEGVERSQAKLDAALEPDALREQIEQQIFTYARLAGKEQAELLGRNAFDRAADRFFLESTISMLDLANMDPANTLGYLSDLHSQTMGPGGTPYFEERIFPEMQELLVTFRELLQDIRDDNREQASNAKKNGERRRRIAPEAQTE